MKDAQQLITKVLQARPEVKKDAKGAIVGMTGGSYGGGIQANVAETDPRIRAINPGRTWNHLAYSLDPNNYVAPGDPTGFTHELNQQGVFKQEWTSLFFASGNGNPVGGVPADRHARRHLPAGQARQRRPGHGRRPGLPRLLRSRSAQTFAKLIATGDADAADRALLADSSADRRSASCGSRRCCSRASRDTLFNVNDAAATYTALQRRGVPVQMVWNSGGHGGYDSLPGECDVYGRGTAADYRASTTAT